jgi:hypothetical protein
MPRKYITRFIDRHGKTRTYFRRGDLRVPLPNEFRPGGVLGGGVLRVHSGNQRLPIISIVTAPPF